MITERDFEIAQELGEDALLEVFEYLDELRESGRTNMWAASGFVQDELGWERKAAGDATSLWMKTFSHAPLAERVSAALSELR